MNLTTSLFQIQVPPTKTFFSVSLQHPKYISSSSKQTMPPDTEDDDDDMFVPLSHMRQWTNNKPRGFGEGKVYDTSLEDKLLDHTRAAPQLANINNLKNNQQPNGVRVRLFNLPKKKNIHRDLQAACKPFPGVINIIPAVSGNHKTRDPLCKGFAFVHFNSHKEANRFVDILSTQPITFGKLQKQIRCEIMKPLKPSPQTIQESPLPVTETPSVQPADLVSASDDDNDSSFGELVEQKQEAQVTSEKQKMVTLTEKGKKTARANKKVENTPKLNIPGSANRLKMKEKALLSGVFSKYGGRSSD